MTEWEKLWKEANTSYFKIITLQVPGGTEECYDISKPRSSSPRQDSHRELPKTQVQKYYWLSQPAGEERFPSKPQIQDYVDSKMALREWWREKFMV
jgi:hypothetical protein